MGWILLFFPAIISLFNSWFEKESYYFHAPFTLLMAIISAMPFLWQEPKVLTLKFKILAYGLLFFAFVLQILAALHSIHFVEFFALWLSCLAFALLQFGPNALVIYRWPLFFLLLSLPLPAFALTHFSFILRQLSGNLSFHLLSLLYPKLTWVGSELIWQKKIIEISEACSGLKTLFTTLSIAAMWSYFEKNNKFTFSALMLGIPLAIFANIIRIILLCISYFSYNFLIVEGGLHEFIGIFAYLIGLIPIFLLSFIFVGKKSIKQAAGSFSHLFKLPLISVSGKTICLIVLAGVLELVFTIELHRIRPTIDQTLKVNTRVPKAASDWKKEEVLLDARTYDIIGTKDAHMWMYSYKKLDDMPIYFYLVRAEGSRTVAHPTEICYEAEGYSLMEKKIINLSLAKASLVVNEMLFKKNESLVLVYSWYSLGKWHTPSYLLHQLHWLLEKFSGRSESSEMLRISTDVKDYKILDAKRRIQNFLNNHPIEL